MVEGAIISLTGAQPLARGGHRAVYAHPQDSRLLVKTVLPEIMQRPKRVFRAGGEKYLTRENREARRLERLGYQTPHMAQTMGVVSTDIGDGILSEAVVLPGGTLAPTLDELRSRLSEPAFAAAIDEFCEWAKVTPAILSDPHPRNVVVTSRSDGQPRLVLIDGYGSATLLPLRAWFSWLNRRRNKRLVARLNRLLRV